MSGSIIADYNEIVVYNGGEFRDMWNKCGPISMGNSMGIDSDNYIELIVEMLGLHVNEQLDFEKKRHQIQELCDMLQIGICVHCAKKLDNNLIRIWRACQIEFAPNSIQQMKIHILWYGGHFEYVNWTKVSDYPEYDENVYELLEKDGNESAQSLLYQYNVIYSTISI